MNKLNKDRLSFRSAIEIRSDERERRIGGLAIAVETRSELLGGMFYETVSREAVTQDLIESQDCRLLVNHDLSRGTLARSKNGHGSLSLRVTERGLEFETVLPDTPLGDEVWEGIRRGDYDAMSFAFMADAESWKENEDGTYDRSIDSIKVLDEISILSVAPAYQATEVALRSLDAFKNSNETEQDMKKTDKRAKRDEEVKDEELEQKAEETQENETQDEEREAENQEDTQENETQDEERDAEDQETDEAGDEERDAEDQEADGDGEPIEDRATLKAYFTELRSQIA